MAFDASVIADIGGNTPDLAGSQAKALTLADLYDQNTLNKAKVAETKQSQSDMTYAKQILAGKDLSKLEDQNAAVAQITKRSPQLGMQLMKGFQDQQSGKNENDLQQLKLHEAKNDIMGQAIEPLKAKHDQLLQQLQQQNPKASPQQLEQQVDQAMRQDMFGAIKNLVGQKLPNGQPVLNEQDIAFVKQNFAQGYNPQAVDMLVARSKQAKEAIQMKLKERQETDRERRTDISERRADASIAQGAAKTRAGEEGRLDPEDAIAMAQQYLAGDKSVMTGLGRGAQGAGNIIAVRRAIRTEGEKQGLKPADIAARLAEYNGYTAEQRALGTRSANIETASTEAYKMIDIAKKASDDVPRGTFRPWNQLVKGENVQTNDPAYAKFAAATLAVVNTWARAISPSGVPTVADKEHANSVLNTAQSQEAYNAVLDQFKTEIAAALNAPSDVKQALHDRFVGGAGGGGKKTATEPAADPSVPLPASAGTSTGGWGKATVVTQ
jgi:hypothetical protein